MSNSTNASTLSPDAQAFVDNTKNIIVGGGVVGAFVVVVMVALFLCCRCIKNRTNEDAKATKRDERKAVYEAKVKEREVKEQLEKERAERRRSRNRPGFVPEYDRNLEKSFAAAMNLQPDNDMQLDDEDDGDINEVQESVISGSRYATSVAGEARSQVSDDSDDGSRPPERDRKSEHGGEMSAVELDMLTAQHLESVHRRKASSAMLKVPPLLVASVRHATMPRTEAEEFFSSQPGARYMVAVEQMLMLDRAREEQNREIREKRVESSGDVIDREGQQILSGLPSPQRMLRDLPHSTSARLSSVPVDVFLKRR